MRRADRHPAGKQTGGYKAGCQVGYVSVSKIMVRRFVVYVVWPAYVDICSLLVDPHYFIGSYFVELAVFVVVLFSRSELPIIG